MKNAIAEALKIADTITSALEDFSLVVAALCEAISVRAVEGIENVFAP